MAYGSGTTPSDRNSPRETPPVSTSGRPAAGHFLSADGLLLADTQLRRKWADAGGDHFFFNVAIGQDGEIEKMVSVIEF